MVTELQGDKRGPSQESRGSLHIVQASARQREEMKRYNSIERCRQEKTRKKFHSARKIVCLYVCCVSTKNLNGERSVDRSVGVDGAARIRSRIVYIQSRDLKLPATNTTIFSNLFAILCALSTVSKHYYHYYFKRPLRYILFGMCMCALAMSSFDN